MQIQHSFGDPASIHLVKPTTALTTGAVKSAIFACAV
jgi:hypothetical protein